MKSNDIVKRNILKVAKLFPNCLVEGKDENGETRYQIDFDMLRQELSENAVADSTERYRFTWPGKRYSIQLANAPTSMTLRPCRDESIDFDTTENLYMEGDNLDVLKILRGSYEEKIKMIYIDPPYNTRNDSFVYNDTFSMSHKEFSKASGAYDEDGNLLFDMYKNNETSGQYHTDWLNMMYPRLKVARDLLTDDGVILINIDENEIKNLQNICSEIFGESNDLGTIVWDKRNPKGDARGISYQHEYILVYAKDRQHLLSKGKIRRKKKNAETILKKAASFYSKISDSYTLQDINKDFSKWIKQQSEFTGGEKAYCKIDENGDVYRPVSMAWPNKKKAPDNYFIPLIHPVTHKPCPVPARGWRNPPAKMELLMKQGRILFGKDETTIPNSKYYLKENMYENIPSLLHYGGSDTDMLKQLGIPFDTPKVVDICKDHISSFTSSDDIVLDFFSGSATTAHAVMKLNSEDGGNRKFIMVQIPEPCKSGTALKRHGFKNICEAGKERIKRAGEKIREDAPNTDVGFRVLRLDSSNLDDKEKIKEGRTQEDLIFQIMPELKIKMSSAIQHTNIGKSDIYSVNNNQLIICFGSVKENILKEFASKEPEFFIVSDDKKLEPIKKIFSDYSPKTCIKIL